MRHPMHTNFDWNDAPHMRVPGAPAEARRGRSSAAGMPRIPEFDWSRAPNVRDSHRQGPQDAAAVHEEDACPREDGVPRLRVCLHLRKSSTDLARVRLAVLTYSVWLVEGS